MQANARNLPVPPPGKRLRTGQSGDRDSLLSHNRGDAADQEGWQRDDGELPFVLLRLYEDREPHTLVLRGCKVSTL